MSEALFQAYRRAVMFKPGASRKEAFDRFLADMRDDPKWLEILARDYFDRKAAAWAPREGAMGYVFSRMPQSERRSELRQQESEARGVKSLATIKAKLRDVILMDMVLPNGKLLREATGADCEKAGGFFAEIARHIKPAHVVDKHLTETDLQNIRARFFQANREAA